MVESPRFSNANRDYDQLFLDLKWMADKNGQLANYNAFMEKFNTYKEQEIDKIMHKIKSLPAQPINSLYEFVSQEKILRRLFFSILFL